MKLTSLNDLTKLPESETANTLAVLTNARHELSIDLVKQRDQHETIRHQGAVELLDKMITLLNKHKQ